MELILIIGRWAGVKAIEVKEEEKEKYPIPNKKG